MSGDQAEWLAWRRAGLGASDVAAALTGAYGRSPMSVVADKLGLLDTTPDAATQAIFDRGHDLEPRITTATEALTGWHVVGEQTWCQHPEHPHHRATVDGFLSTEPEASIDDVAGLFECKTRGAGRPRHLDYYTAQVNWQMWVTGLDVALLTEATVDEAGAIVGTRSWSIERDNALIERLVEMADEMWSWIQRGEVPPPTVAVDLKVVAELTRDADADADAVDLSGMVDDLAEYDRLGAEASTIKARRDLIAARIKHAIGPATKAGGDGWRVSYSAPARTLDKALLAAAYPDLDLDDFKRSIGARRLTISPPKGTS